jgi:shikimate kinase
MRYFIIGFKNSGKTTFGKKLADFLGMEFIDLDEYIEQKEHKSIPELYSQLGEEKFRRTEWKALKEVVQHENVVIATGGGAPCNCDNMNLMEKYGEVIYLRVSNATLVGRLSKAAKDRPIVMGKNEEQLIEYVSDLRKKCEHHYKRAKYIIDAEDTSAESVAEQLKR